MQLGAVVLLCHASAALAFSVWLLNVSLFHLRVCVRFFAIVEISVRSEWIVVGIVLDGDGLGGIELFDVAVEDIAVGNMALGDIVLVGIALTGSALVDIEFDNLALVVGGGFVEVALEKMPLDRIDIACTVLVDLDPDHWALGIRGIVGTALDRIDLHHTALVARTGRVELVLDHLSPEGPPLADIYLHHPAPLVGGHLAETTLDTSKLARTALDPTNRVEVVPVVVEYVPDKSVEYLLPLYRPVAASTVPPLHSALAATVVVCP